MSTKMEQVQSESDGMFSFLFFLMKRLIFFFEEITKEQFVKWFQQPDFSSFSDATIWSTLVANLGTPVTKSKLKKFSFKMLVDMGIPGLIAQSLLVELAGKQKNTFFFHSLFQTHVFSSSISLR